MDKILIPSFKNDLCSWRDDNRKRAVLLMSGGVDSTAAAIILQNEGYSVAGLTMKISDSTKQSACDSAADVCRILSIPHFSVDIKEEFHARVSTPFCRAYTLGMTPNPCADCNEQIKFGLLWDIAEKKWGIDFALATGHYARIVNLGQHSYLARSTNIKKDQSYFLSGISPDRIRRILFPLGEYQSKDDTRKLVRNAGIPLAEKPESMEICFADEKNYRALIEMPSSPGEIRDPSGNIIGIHNGIANYTLGQRKGMGIASKYPLFVIAIIPCSNIIIAAPREKAFSEIVNAKNINILAPEYITPGTHLFGKIRSQGEPSPCSIVSRNKNSISVKFKIPMFAPAPGQRLVLYTSEGFVAAGGIITI